MRETLYRGKRTDNEEWVEGDLIHRMCNQNERLFIRSEGEGTLLLNMFDAPVSHKLFGFEVKPSTVGQHIGRLDKNQRRIFGGDIVETKYGRACVVKWVSFSGHVGWDLIPVGMRENLKHDAPDGYDIWHPDNLRVIGNVFDNPELLKEDE